MRAILRNLAGLATLTAQEAEKPVLEAARSLASSGVDPTTGAAWAPTVDGRKALEGAADAIEVTQAGPTLRLKISGKYVYHQYGARGGKLPQRRIIPDKGGDLPPTFLAALKAAAARAFAKATK